MILSTLSKDSNYEISNFNNILLNEFKENNTYNIFTYIWCVNFEGTEFLLVINSFSKKDPFDLDLNCQLY